MNILGISCDYHDAAAALLVDGRIVAATQEERFSRRKQDPRLPLAAARYCLQEAGLAANQLDGVVFYEHPLLKLDRIRRTSQQARLHEVLARWLAEGRLDVRNRLATGLGIDPAKVAFVRHHDSHAASAFFCSPFEEAVVVTIDGVGESETATVSIGRGNRLERIAAVEFPHSVGLLYSGFTAFLGFEVNEGEYKVMGMAGFGKPRFADAILAKYRLFDDGSFALEQDFFDFSRPDGPLFSDALLRWLGPPRRPESRFADDSALGPEEQHYADIAASIQRCTEEVVLHMVRSAMRRTGLSNVCLAGGVALNSVANYRLQTELGCRLFVQPAAGDAGGALGAALYQHNAVLGRPRSQRLATPYLGKAFGRGEAIAAAQRDGWDPVAMASDDALFAAVAQRLAAGKVGGWLRGRAEWGPRALGARSILASPLGPDVQARVNEKIKFRERFRPFAPSVLEERAGEFFDIQQVFEGSPEYFMLSVCPVRPDKRHLIPAVTHVDGSARVQIVSERMSPDYHRLIRAFGEITGVPVVLNTSFNLRGEPIVNSPADALTTFGYSNMDFLAMENVLVEK